MKQLIMLSEPQMLGINSKGWPFEEKKNKALDNVMINKF